MSITSSYRLKLASLTYTLKTVIEELRQPRHPPYAETFSNGMEDAEGVESGDGCRSVARCYALPQ